MKEIREFSNHELTWEQPDAFKMQYELCAGGDLLGTLRFRSSFGSYATAECESGCWTFKRVGFFMTKVSIRPCESGADIAFFVNNTWSGGGSLEFTDGRKYLASTNFWQTRYEFTTETGDVLVRFKHHAGIRASSSMEITPVAVSIPETPLLACLGWYLAILLRIDSGTAV